VHYGGTHRHTPTHRGHSMTIDAQNTYWVRWYKPCAIREGGMLVDLTEAEAHEAAANLAGLGWSFEIGDED